MTKKDMLTENLVPCGCGRSPSGYCTGLHEMSEQEYEKYLLSEFDEGDDNDSK